MDSSNFYVHLQSNSSPAFFPNNKITDFRNQLAAPMKIDPTQYEVALAQCSYVFNPPYIKAGTYLGEVTAAQDIIKGEITNYHSEYSTLIPNYHHSKRVIKNFIAHEDAIKHYVDSRGQNISKLKDHSHNFDPDKELFEIREDTRTHIYLLPDSIKSRSKITELINSHLKFYDLELKIAENGGWVIDGIKQTSIVSVKFHKDICKLYWSYHEGEICGGSDIIDPEYAIIEQDQELFTIKLFVHRRLILPYHSTLKTTIARGKVNNVRLISKNQNNVSKYMWEATYGLWSTRDCYNISELMEELTDNLPGCEFKIMNNLCHISLTDYLDKFKLSDQIEAIFGTTESNVSVNSNGKKQIIGKFRPFFGHGQQKMFIYADIVEDQFIGGQVAPILRIADYKGEREKTTTQEFEHHHYVSLKNIPMDQIHMYIRSETADHLPIELGSFSATLHFRRRQY